MAAIAADGDQGNVIRAGVLKIQPPGADDEQIHQMRARQHQFAGDASGEKQFFEGVSRVFQGPAKQGQGAVRLRERLIKGIDIKQFGDNFAGGIELLLKTMHLEVFLLTASQHLMAIGGHQNRMLPLGGLGMILGDHGPAVLEQFNLTFSGIDHRLNGENHAGFEHDAGSRSAVMQDLRFFVK